ncbi:hypothetical protein GF354_03550, partial [Candidatus Peregrinibacteria bacterium]|nr:hypothetical protein [Candidatus Peregrinibacteria bacterium]
MKKYFFIVAFILLAIFNQTAFAEDITYCASYESYDCSYETDTFKDFLDNLDETYFETNNFQTFENYVYLEDPYFKFYIPNYVTEFQLFDEYGGYVSSVDWEDIDLNKNKVHDDIDDLIDSFKKIEQKYFGSSSYYKLDKWNGKLSVLIDYSCYYSLSDNSCVYGYYAPNDEYAASFDISGNYIMIDPEGALLGPLELERDKYDTQSTIAHEVFHAIQNVYISDSFFWNNYAFDNFFEGTAVSMQRNAVSSSQEYLYYIADSQFQYPSYSIFGPTPSQEMANYGSFIWYNFLERKYGKDIVEKLLYAYSTLEEYPNVYRSFLANLKAIEEEGDNIYSAYLEYVKWNYDKEKYTYSDSLKDVYIAKTHTYYPTGEVVMDEEKAPTLFASNYVEFDLRSKDENLHVDFEGNNEADLYVTFLPIDG